MELIKDEIIENYAKHCRKCRKNTSLQYEDEYNCVSCGYNILKRKHELTKIQRKKISIE